ncbi:MAG TPA: SDR family NAD(P)-dependent oxidoreductase [Candidatus Limiplasma sp.]|nr:SDR family NAD(P)-dependent oxidoreductase [Candidatus Limiplasma sp.]
MEKGTVWIIGGSSGLGLATAKAFAADGWFVVSGARSFHNEAQSGSIRSLQLDVTDPESRNTFMREALALRPRVDVLVYCAAILVLSPCESTAYEEYARVMQTNFLGITAFVSYVMPMMREQKNGKIVLFSSINGLLGIPFQSAYVASKHAVEGYAECLAMECKAMGIQVCVIEPGDHRGGSQRCRLSTQLAEASPYRDAFAKGIAIIRHDEANGLLPSGLAEAVLKNVNRKHMRFRVRVAKADQKLAVILHDILPPSMNTRILRDYYGKK